MLKVEAMVAMKHWCAHVHSGRVRLWCGHRWYVELGHVGRDGPTILARCTQRACSNVGRPAVKSLIARSPLFLADRVKKPLLIIQGANDPRVNKEESGELLHVVAVVWAQLGF
ncbi:hypothetical protein COOONC_02571 [Cooperia oncophora]